MGPVSSRPAMLQITLKLEKIPTQSKEYRPILQLVGQMTRISLLEATDTRLRLGDIGLGQSVDVSVNLKAGSRIVVSSIPAFGYHA